MIRGGNDGFGGATRLGLEGKEFKPVPVIVVTKERRILLLVFRVLFARSSNKAEYMYVLNISLFRTRFFTVWLSRRPKLHPIK